MTLSCYLGNNASVASKKKKGEGGEKENWLLSLAPKEKKKKLFSQYYGKGIFTELKNCSTSNLIWQIRILKFFLVGQQCHSIFLNLLLYYSIQDNFPFDPPFVRVVSPVLTGG